MKPSALGSPQAAVDSRQSAVGSQQSAIGSRKPAVEIDEALARRVVVEHIAPEVDGGRFPIKRTIAEGVDVTADIFGDGHDVVVAILRDRHETAGVEADPRVGSADWRETR